MKPSEVLLAARELVAAKFLRFDFAKTESGRRVGVLHPQASCFCTVGALRRASGRRRVPASVLRFMRRVGWAGFGTHDNSTHLENVVRLEKAALLAMSEGQ